MKKTNYALLVCVLFSTLLLAQNKQKAIDKLKLNTQAQITVNSQSGVPEFIRFHEPITLSGVTLHEKNSNVFGNQ